MAKQTINHGTTAGDKTGESLFAAFKKSKENFDELYGAKPTFVADEAALPVMGEAAKIYVAIDTGVLYRWGGSAYVALTFGVGTDASGNTALVGADGALFSLFGPSVLTVGAKGRFATLRDAIDYINTQTYIETLHTGSYTYADGARILTASANISTGTIGKQLFLQHDTDALLYPIEVHNQPSSSAIMRPFYPLYGRTAGATDFSIVSPTANWVIVLLPGRHAGDGAPLEIPPFTSVIGYGKEACIFEDEVSAINRGIIEIPASSQHVVLKGFSVFNHGTARGGSVMLTDENASVITTGQRIVIDDFHTQSIGGSEDGIWKRSDTKNVLDSIRINNLSGTGYYDTIALFGCRSVDITDCDIYSINAPDQDLPQSCSLSGNSLVNSTFRVSRNNFRAYNGSTAFSAAAIACKVSATTAGTKNTYVRFDNNIVEVEGKPTSPVIPSLESNAFGLQVAESGVAVGDLVVHAANNIFDCYGADLNYAINSGASGVVFSTNNRNSAGSAITTGTVGGGSLTVVL
ncbi:MAG: hypothetical protein Q8S32_17300 [Burkholderiaceae bacterium]|nr:hypothetical protein [Burkholderiaceae bacterium]